MNRDAEEHKQLLHPALRHEVDAIAQALYSLPPQVRESLVQHRYRKSTPKVLGRMIQKHRRTLSTRDVEGLLQAIERTYTRDEGGEDSTASFGK